MDMNKSSEDILCEAFAEVGKAYGYENVTAVFGAFKDFKVQWTRNYRMAQFRVGDYLEGAPKEAFTGLANTLFARITGKEDVPYSEEMREYVLAPEFAQKWRGLYISRSQSLTRVAQGDERNLLDSVNRLAEAGLIDPSEDIQVCWTKDNSSPRAASCSVLFKLIAVNRTLDDADIPDFVVDYAVYTQWLRITEGRKVFGVSQDVFTRNKETKFENYEGAERLLDKLCLYL